MHGAVAFAAGLGLLVVAAEMVVRGASRLAASLGVEPLLLGLTVVAVGTSIPELAVGITASLQGSGALAVGNIAGTNVFNILFILGLIAVLKPLPLHLQVLKLELPTMVGAAVLMSVFAWDGAITQLDGGVLLVAAVLYTLALIVLSRRETPALKEEFSNVYGADDAGTGAVAGQRAKYAAVLAAGLALSVLGANWLVSGAVDIARTLGLSEAVIGLTIVAVGTSAPELVTSIVATLRDERDVAVGNLLGSSIYNILVILGLTCLVTPGGVPVERQLTLVDIPLMAGVALLCVPVFMTGKRISRLEGGIGIALYLAYMLWLVLFRA
ncbi:MAG: calcium/sodium antiporter [Hyphomicrobium sp.]|nr:calcium/sodium antiporter [Hyphomicrobium sp.]